jgi:hypothetical protein
MSSFLIPKNFKKTYSELTTEEFLSADKNTLKPFLEFMKNI